MAAPIVAYDGIGYEVCLFRVVAGLGSYVKHAFGDHELSVCVAFKEDLFEFQIAQLNCTNEEGRIYYLCARPHDVGGQFLVRLRDEAEALELRKAISVAQAAA